MHTRAHLVATIRQGRPQRVLFLPVASRCHIERKLGSCWAVGSGPGCPHVKHTHTPSTRQSMQNMHPQILCQAWWDAHVSRRSYVEFDMTYVRSASCVFPAERRLVRPPLNSLAENWHSALLPWHAVPIMFLSYRSLFSQGVWSPSRRIRTWIFLLCAPSNSTDLAPCQDCGVTNRCQIR